MKTPKIDRALLAGLVAGLAALSIASTCPHQGATGERHGSNDCVVCTAAGTEPINPPPPACQGKKHDKLLVFCQCAPNSRCEDSGEEVHGQNAEFWITARPSCSGNGECPANRYIDKVTEATLRVKQTTGCSSS